MKFPDCPFPPSLCNAEMYVQKERRSSISAAGKCRSCRVGPPNRIRREDVRVSRTAMGRTRASRKSVEVARLRRSSFRAPCAQKCAGPRPKQTDPRCVERQRGKSLHAPRSGGMGEDKKEREDADGRCGRESFLGDQTQRRGNVATRDGLSAAHAGSVRLGPPEQVAPNQATCSESGVSRAARDAIAGMYSRAPRFARAGRVRAAPRRPCGSRGACPGRWGSACQRARFFQKESVELRFHRCRTSPRRQR